MMTFLNKPALYLASSFLAGFSVMVVELISSRIVAPIIGASVYTWTSVIGLTLLGLALGGWAGGKIADSEHGAKALPITFIASGVFVALIPLLAENASFITNTSNSILKLNLLLSMYLFLLPASAIGMIQPMLLKKYSDTFATIGSTYGRLSASWSIGSMMGVFLTGFFFISTIGSKETIWIISGILFLLGGIFAYYERTVFYLLLISIVTITSIISIAEKDSRSTILFQKETEYYSAKVVDKNIPSLGKSRLLILDFDTHSIESETSSKYSYTELYPVFSYLKPDIKNILVLGAGAYTLPKHFSDYYQGARVVVMETDPEMEKIATHYFDLAQYDIETETGDAKILLQKSTETYDVIFGDAYNSYISVPWYLLTNEWNETVKARLTENGLYAVNFIGSLTGDGSDYTKSIAETFRLSFPNFYVFSLGKSAADVQNIVLIGINGSLPLSESDLEQVIAQGKNAFLAPYLTSSTLVSDSEAIILTDNFSPVERLMEPIVKKYFPRNLDFIRYVLAEE